MINNEHMIHNFINILTINLNNVPKKILEDKENINGM